MGKNHMIDWAKVQESVSKSIRYDRDPPDTCPHCGKELRSGSVWIDHRSELTSVICLAMNLSLEDTVKDILDVAYVTGDRYYDSEDIVKLLKIELVIHDE